MKTPDGQEFEAEAGKSRTLRALGVIGGGVAGAIRTAARWLAPPARFFAAGGMAAGRAVGKAVATVWRLFGALDAALWRGVKLFAGRAFRLAVSAGRLALSGLRDVIRWIPSRAGRAYTSFSAIVLIVFSLYILDETRLAPQTTTDATQRAPVDVADPILARVEGRYVHLSEVAGAALASGALQKGETLTPKTAFARGLVEAYVEQKLLSRAASGEGLHRAPVVANELAAARDRVLASAYMEQKLAGVVTDDAIRRLYSRQADVTRVGEEVRARQVVVETGEEAQAVAAALDAGGDFAALARELSTDRASRNKGGDMGFFGRAQVDPVLAEIAFATPVGTRARPFQTENGWHVLETTDRRQSAGVPLSAVEDGIRKFLRMRTIQATLDQLKQDKEVVYYREAASPAPRSAPPDLREGGPGG